MAKTSRSGNPSKNRQACTKAVANRVHQLKADDRVSPVVFTYKNKKYEVPGTPTPGYLNALAQLDVDMENVDSTDFDNRDLLALFSAFYNYQIGQDLAEAIAREDVSVLSQAYEIWSKHVADQGVEAGES